MSDEELALEPVEINGEIVYVNRFGDLWRWTKTNQHATPKFRKIVTKPNSHGYICPRVNGTHVFQHRIIAKAFLGLNMANLKVEIDHINRTKHDNRLINLRLSDSQKNKFNTGAKGYCWNKTRNKWMASIKLDGKSKTLGYFDEKEDAQQAYLNAKEILHVI